ncbi:MAG: hypothetical protein WCX65_07515 [bacterium]
MSKNSKKQTPGGMIKSFIKNFISTVVFVIALLIVLAVHLQFASEKAVFDTAGAKKISYSPLVKIVPGPGLPAEVKPFKSNNNVDIAKFGDRFYMAFRSAPTHFASTETILYVLSSADAKKWDYETKFKMGSDLREPRFLVFKGKLFLYFFKGGANPLSFAPDSMYVTEFESNGKWTKPKMFYKPGYVIWRAKEHGGKAIMSVYYGVGLYSNETKPSHLQLLESDDGYNYTLINNKDISSTVSSEEGEFEFDAEGNLYATVRQEMKGGEVCFAPKSDITAWDCRFTPFKYDSALMFNHKGDFYVIARRNIAGEYNRDSKALPAFLRSKWYLVRYSLTRKRTALYRLDKEQKILVPVFDFPSRGDTAYAGMVKLDENRYLIVNYSSDINKFDWSWIGGQLVGSNLYSTILEFK